MCRLLIIFVLIDLRFSNKNNGCWLSWPKGSNFFKSLKIAESFLDVLNQVVDDKKDLAKLLNYFEGKMLPRFQKGGSVYGKYAGQIAKLP